MAQVTHIREAEIKEQNDRYAGWLVQWQHSVELEKPDYSNPTLRPGCYPEADARKVKELFIKVGEEKRQKSRLVDRIFIEEGAEE